MATVNQALKSILSVGRTLVRQGEALHSVEPAARYLGTTPGQRLAPSTPVQPSRPAPQPMVTPPSTRFASTDPRKNAVEAFRTSRMLRMARCFDPAVSHARMAVEHEPHNPVYRYELACALLDTGRPEEAESMLASLSESSSATPVMHKWMWGKTLLQLGRLPEGLARQQQFLDKNPTFFKEVMEFVGTLLRCGQPDQALGALYEYGAFSLMDTDLSLDAQPIGHTAQVLALAGYVRTKNYAVVEELAHVFLKRNPHHAAAHAALGMAHIAHEKYAEAATSMQRALPLVRADPEAATYFTPDMVLASHCVCLSSDNLPEALTTLEAALRRDPCNIELHHAQATIAANLVEVMADHPQDDAEMHCLQILAARPKHALTTSILNFLWTRRAFVPQLSADAYAAQAKAAEASGDWSQAVTHYLMATWRDPDNTAFRMPLAYCKVALQDGPGAALAAETAQRMQPNDLALAKETSTLCYQVGAFDTAATIAARALHAFSGDRALLHTLAQARLKLRHYDAAEAALQQIADHDSDPDTLMTLGRVLYGRGDLEKAEDVFKRLVAVDPNNALYHAYLGRACLDMARSVGIMHLEKALSLDADCVVALVALTLSHPLKGHAERARACAQRLAQLPVTSDHRGDVAFALGSICLVDKDVAKAMAWHQESLLSGGPHEALRGLAQLQLLAGDADAARATLMQATQERPLCADNHLAAVAIHAELEPRDELQMVAYKGVEEAALRAAYLCPDVYTYRRWLGAYRAWREDYAGATRAFCDANALYHFQAAPLPLADLLFLGNEQRAAGNLAEATKIFRTATEVEPQSAVAHARLGECLLEAGDLIGADAALTMARHGGEAVARPMMQLRAKQGRFDELLMLEEDAPKPPAAAPVPHTMGEARLRKYCAQRVHIDLIMQALQAGSRKLYTVAQLPLHFEDPDNLKSLGVTDLQPLHKAKSRKVFNAMRPMLYTAKVHGQPALVYAISPGPAYFSHYDSMLTHLMGNPWQRLGPAAGANMAQLLQPLDKVPVEKGDVVVMGLVQPMRHALEDIFGWPLEGAKQHVEDALYGAYRFPLAPGKNVVFLGVKYSYWGDLAGEIAAHLVQRGCSEIVYCSKLGSMTCRNDMFTRLYSANRYAVYQDNVEIDHVTDVENGLLSQLGKAEPALHISVPTMLEERCDFAQGVLDRGAQSIDNENGYIAAALSRHNRAHGTNVKFTPLQYATDFLEVNPMPGLTGLESKRDMLLFRERNLAVFRQAYALDAHLRLMRGDTLPAGRDPFNPHEKLLLADTLRCMSTVFKPENAHPQLVATRPSQDWDAVCTAYYNAMLDAADAKTPPMLLAARMAPKQQSALHQDGLYPQVESASDYLYRFLQHTFGGSPEFAVLQTWPHSTEEEVNALVAECRRICDKLTPAQNEILGARGARFGRRDLFDQAVLKIGVDAWRRQQGRPE